MKKVVVVETRKANVTPKAFWNYARREAAKKGADLTLWTDFAGWAEDTLLIEEDEDEGICSSPFKLKMYEKNAYFFSLQFDFCSPNKGSGYLCLEEYTI